MSIISQEQKIIDLENEISFLKDRLYEEQEQNEYLRDKVDKQQKEIEELKKDKKDNIQVIYGGRRFGTEGMVVKDYIDKDKIKEKIKELEHKDFRAMQVVRKHDKEALKIVDVLKELLEEK